MKIYVDGNPVDVEVYVDSGNNTLTLVTGDKKSSVQLIKFYGKGTGLGEALLNHVLLHNLSTPVGAVGNGSEPVVKSNKHKAPL